MSLSINWHKIGETFVTLLLSLFNVLFVGKFAKDSFFIVVIIIIIVVAELAVVVVIMISKILFIVLSSYERHCNSSLVRI